MVSACLENVINAAVCYSLFSRNLYVQIIVNAIVADKPDGI